MTKQTAPMIVPIIENFLALLECSWRPGLVLVDKLGKPVRPEFYSDRFRRLSRQAGLRVIHLHLVRHTLAVAMDRARIAPVDAAPLLGHTVDVYISTYLRPSEQGARNAASALGSACRARDLRCLE